MEYGFVSFSVLVVPLTEYKFSLGGDSNLIELMEEVSFLIREARAGYKGRG